MSKEKFWCNSVKSDSTLIFRNLSEFVFFCVNNFNLSPDSILDLFHYIFTNSSNPVQKLFSNFSLQLQINEKSNFLPNGSSLLEVCIVSL